MGFVGSLLGTAGGAGGTGFSGPSGASIQTPVTTAQANVAGQTANDTLAQQQAFVQATQPGGLAGLASQQQLLGQLGLQAQGQGPNPALDQLNQTTGQNVASQAALMAGQRGSNQNAGLMARQAAQQGAATQQNAVGQAATMRAQQQLAAQQNLMAQQQAMVGQQSGATNSAATSAQNEQANLLNSIAGTNSANVANQGNVNTNNSSMAGIGMQGQQHLVGGIMNMIGGGSSMLGAEGGKVPNDLKRMASGGIAPMAPLNGPQSTLGQHLAGMTQAPAVAVNPSHIDPVAGASTPSVPDYFKDMGKKSMGKKSGSGDAAHRSDAATKQDYGNANSALGTSSEQGGTNAATQGDASNFEGMQAAEGGKVPALLSPGERYLSPSKVEAVRRGANPIAEGKKIPGKPKVGGAKNSYANDTVKATLDEGGIVIPRSITQSKDAEKKAVAFVRDIIAKNRLK